MDTSKMEKKWGVSHMDDPGILEVVSNDKGNESLSMYSTAQEAAVAVIDIFTSQMDAACRELLAKAEQGDAPAILASFDREELPQIEFCVIEVFEDDDGSVYDETGEIINWRKGR